LTGTVYRIKLVYTGECITVPELIYQDEPEEHIS